MSETLTITLTNKSTGATGTATVTLQTTSTPPPPTTPPPTGSPTPPAQASNAGYKNLVFSDDFTDPSTIATSFAEAYNSKVKWYWSGTVGTDQAITPASWRVNTTAKASGAAASAAGGLLMLDSVRGAKNIYWGNSTLCTFPGNAHPASVPTNTAWSDFYAEMYAQTSTLASPTGLQLNGWPAFWAWSVQGAQSFNGGWSGSQPSTEVDIVEVQAGLWGNASGAQFANIMEPGGTKNVFDARYPTLDTNWHKWGLLHANKTLTFFYDDHPIGSHDASALNLELHSQSLFLILGTGINWPLHVDWVRVWQ